MSTLIAVLAVAAALGAAIGHIVKNKKKGKNCIGCPYAGSCSKDHCD